MAEARLALGHEVEEAPGRRDEKVATSIEGLALPLVAHAAHEHHGAVMCVGTDVLRGVIDLLGELAGRGYHEHRGTSPCAVVSQTVECWQKEGRSLSCARLCGCHDVSACQDEGDGPRLDGGWRPIAHVSHRSERCRTQSKPTKTRRIIRKLGVCARISRVCVGVARLVRMI